MVESFFRRSASCVVVSLSSTLRRAARIYPPTSVACGSAGGLRALRKINHRYGRRHETIQTAPLPYFERRGHETPQYTPATRRAATSTAAGRRWVGPEGCLPSVRYASRACFPEAELQLGAMRSRPRHGLLKSQQRPSHDQVHSASPKKGSFAKRDII
jgi:hypothetical protein